MNEKPESNRSLIDEPHPFRSMVIQIPIRSLDPDIVLKAAIYSILVERHLGAASPIVSDDVAFDLVRVIVVSIPYDEILDRLRIPRNIANKLLESLQDMKAIEILRERDSGVDLLLGPLTWWDVCCQLIEMFDKFHGLDEAKG